MAPLTDERRAEIQAALDAVPAPPWHWIGDTKHQGPMLATKHSGWIYVMGFKRLGMHGAQPAFPVKGPDGYLLITPCREIEERSSVAAKEVAIPRAPYDPDTVRGIDNPVAKWLEHSAQYAKELLSQVEWLRAKLDAPCGSCHPCTNYADETWRAAGRTPPHVAEWDERRAELERLKEQRAALIALHEYDELIFGGFICLHCTPDECDDPDDNVMWPCPSLRAVGMTDDEAIALIEARRAEIEKAARERAEARAVTGG
ncbi:hypothetical protein [Microbispora sp. CA-102843]|uniref:hypothetical protein n=1 Tax=Microbispora sp. CA-102843 TaxID=3239952 RepID=UPI003D8E1D8E